ncbi:MAG: PRC-barrel domain-containing protein [Burkholderiaceae bacterium]
MLRLIKDREKCTIGATDGDIGRVKDFYFDDAAWVIRYVVVKAGAWLSGREVLVSPYSVSASDWKSTILPVSITKEQARRCSSVTSLRNGRRRIFGTATCFTFA